jgi:tRNA-Thr(GGU) m(6)t(6)A37 methyltransferase TsaA
MIGFNREKRNFPPFITLRPIGILHTPFRIPKGMPIQPRGARGALGKVEVFPEYAEGLKDIEGFSHLLLLYHFDRSRLPSLFAKAFLDNEIHGIFATRAPQRPNPIGISVVRLDSVIDNILEVRDMDMLDGTPLLDVKPYVPAFDSPCSGDIRIGWLTKAIPETEFTYSDERFYCDT